MKLTVKVVNNSTDRTLFHKLVHCGLTIQLLSMVGLPFSNLVDIKEQQMDVMFVLWNLETKAIT
jgi:hypothetical protein